MHCPSSAERQHIITPSSPVHFQYPSPHLRTSSTNQIKANFWVPVGLSHGLAVSNELASTFLRRVSKKASLPLQFQDFIALTLIEIVKRRVAKMSTANCIFRFLAACFSWIWFLYGVQNRLSYSVHLRYFLLIQHCLFYFHRRRKGTCQVRGRLHKLFIKCREIFHITLPQERVQS